MKMAKADNQEWKDVMDFANKLEEDYRNPKMSDAEFGGWVRSNFPPLHRVVYGYRVLVDNCCNPDSDALEFRSDIAAFLEQHKKSNSVAEGKEAHQ